MAKNVLGNSIQWVWVMKKPCIIATKFATKILKDDDSVEVDADEGTVTILERKS